MPNLALHTAIEELLLRDHFACIPQLGGFLLKASDSTVNAYTKELKPTHSQLVFNPQLSENDGQLAHLLSISTGITYKDALSQIESAVSELKTQLRQKRYATFFPFGNFFHNEHKGIFFVARQQFNLHLPNYGLQPVKWEAHNAKSQSAKVAKVWPQLNTLLESETEEATVMSVSAEHVDSAAEKTRSNAWWQIAASFVVISISALTLTISTMTWMEAYQERQQYASLSPLYSSDIEESKEVIATNGGKSQKEPNSQSDFVYINGKLIKINGNVRENSSYSHGESATTEISEPVIKSEPNEGETTSTILNADAYLDQLLDQTGSIFIVGGSYMTANAARIECQQWIQAGTPAAIFKPKNSSFYRIVLGRFNTKQEANDYSVNIKSIPNANLSMVRWNIK